MNRHYFIILVLISFFSCKDKVTPKPNSQLRLEYQAARFENFSNNSYIEFEKNILSSIKQKGDESIELHYPRMKATVYLTYKPVSGNLDKLLGDAQKLTYDHAIKANDIAEQPFINPKKKVYGMFYQVGGNAATNAQFYATDSIKNFVVGSMYFYTKPNFDSILPAADYIKNDMRQIMETLKWKK